MHAVIYELHCWACQGDHIESKAHLRREFPDLSPAERAAVWRSLYGDAA